MKGYLLLVLALSWWQPLAIATQSPSAAILKTDARAEVAAALYAASSTQAAAQKVADDRLKIQREEIESLRARVLEGEVRLRSELAAAEEKYVAALVARDRSYAQEIAVFREALESIAATPEGVAALARFNAGDEVGALAVLDDLRAARDAARQRRADIESAAEARHNATLALEARNRGKITTARAIARFEEVTRLDPSVHWDWVELGRLYMQAGRLPDALRATKAATDTAENDRDHSVALHELGIVQVAQGNLPAALASYRAFLAIAERLAQANPGNTEWQRDLSISHERIGDVQTAEGNLPAALASFQASHVIRERLAKADPGNEGWQRDLSVSLNKIGDVQTAQGNLPAALASFQGSHVIRERLAKADPGNKGWQRDLSISHERIGNVQTAQGNLSAALASFEADHSIAERLAQADPGNATWQRDLSISHGRMGDVQVAQGNLPAALASYQASMAIAERLAQADPGNAEWHRDLVIGYVKLNKASGDKAYAVQALEVALAMQQRGILAPRDSWMIEDLKRLGRQ